ncbi:uncharacterized protein LOC122650634 [Telopea speciosissima]|uniref:uncharacterized protein LOC122650634 n=1 Tax=Telopea speciosissima TaxID=54955 RepID=UPI001CC663F6|nr:uncharacterized protein LOC122650634 [Telopea speciosissima]
MDKSWIHKSRDRGFRAGDIYEAGVNGFLNFAFSKVPIGEKILCPCVNCINQRLGTWDEVFDHLIVDGIMTGYTIWSFHGDDISSNTTVTENVTVDEEDEDIVNMHDILQDAFPGQTFEGVGVGTTSGHTEEIRDDSQKLHRLMQEAEKALYPKCNKFINRHSCCIISHKVPMQWSDKSFSMLLDLLKKALPQGNTLPNSLYEAKKMVKDLGLSYNKIDACPNDCMLYWKDASNEKSYRICGASRYESKSKVPEKTLRHFPLIPRVQRLYRSSVTSSDMRWHKDGRIDDGKIRHPADAEAWKDL